MAKVVLFGVSQWAELAHFYLTHDSPHEVAAFTVDRDFIAGDQFKDLAVVAFDEVERHYPPDQFKMFIPVSFKRMNHIRAEKYYEAKSRGYELISYVSSRATIFPGLECGDNCFILEDNTRHSQRSPEPRFFRPISCNESPKTPIFQKTKTQTDN